MGKVVIRKGFIAGFLCTLYLCSEAQSTRSSFTFNNEPWSVALKSVAESFGLYLSYDPDLVKEDSIITATYKNRSLPEMLNDLLGIQYNYEIIQDYLVVTVASSKPVPASSQRTLIVPQRVTVYDTIKVDQYITRYDTQLVKRYEVVYDTTVVEKLEYVYDTVRVEYEDIGDEPDQFRFIAYLAPSIWNRSINQKDKIYTGIAAGVSVKHHWEKVRISLDLDYNFLLSNVKYTESVTSMEFQVDTVSTFYIIENGERVPIYVTDSTIIKSESQRQIDRCNIIQILSANFFVGYYKNFKKVRIGADTGMSLDWIAKRDEVILLKEEGLEEEKVEYEPLLWSINVQFPVSFKNERGFDGFYLAPYGKIVLNPDIINMKSMFRYSMGFKIGAVF